MQQGKRVVSVCAGFTVLGLGILASAHGGDATRVHSCVAKDGSIRIILPAAWCKTNETALDWSVTGPQGPAGVAGPSGPSGGLRVVSTEGEQVGEWVDWDYMRVKLPDQRLLYLKVLPSGVDVAQNMEIYYTEPNCLGTEYTDDPALPSLIPVGIAIGENVYIRGVDQVVRQIRSYRPRLSTGVTGCQAANRETTLATLEIIALADLNLPSGPYHLVEP